MAQLAQPPRTTLDRPPTGTGRPGLPRRPLLARFSLVHAVMVLSGLATFVLIAVALGDRRGQVEVAVARADIGAGSVVSPSVVSARAVDAGSQLLPRLATLDDLGTGRWVATKAVAAGDPIRRSDLSRDDPSDGRRTMSIPVPRENAVGGALAAGDRIDVIDVLDGRAAFVVAGAEVVKVASPGSPGSLAGEARSFSVVVRVNAGEALAIAQALVDGKLDIVRAPAAGAAMPPFIAPLPAQTSSPTGARR